MIRFPLTAAPLALLLAIPAYAADPAGTTPGDVPVVDEDRPKPPQVSGSAMVSIDFGETTLKQLTKLFADWTGKNFILDDNALNEKVTIISHREVTVNEAYEAFLQALEINGYTTITVGKTVRIVKSGEASGNPIVVGQGGDIPNTANFVTQIIKLENVNVSDVQSIVQALLSSNAKIIAYPPSNTLIVTDTAHNLRKVYDILSELDVAAPKSRIEVIQVNFADAADVKALIEELYGTAQSDPTGTARTTQTTGTDTTRRPRRPRPDSAEATPAATTSDSVTGGKESRFIDKVLSDERTNKLIVLANEEGLQSVRALLEEIDVDVDLSRSSQIHVVYLQNAKAEDVATVLSNLSQSGSSSSSTGTRRTGTTGGTTGRQTTPAGQQGAGAAGREAEGGGGSSSVTAAFDSGMRITQDESTNSLVIIANNDDFRIIKGVIDQLDVRRRQVLIDAVILELTSTESNTRSVAYHGPFTGGLDNVANGTGADGSSYGLLGGQFGTNSLGLSQDLLSGLAVGVFGPTVTVPGALGSGDLEVPVFGIVMQALRADASVDIVSNPELLTLDNEEAKIVVGRKVPFPSNTSFSQLGTPITSYTREDIATTLTVTPRVNSSNAVTLEVSVEVAEVEKNGNAETGVDVNSAGLITSKREIETVAIVGDNQTVVLGGLVGTTQTISETKVPLLGDLPVLGVLFRSKTVDYRKSNLMIFLTPHIIDDDADMMEIMKVKEAQREAYIRLFYGKSHDEQIREIDALLRYSMNRPGQPSVYPNNTPGPTSTVIDGEPLSPAAQDAVRDELGKPQGEPGDGAGAIPVGADPLPEPDDDLPEEDGGN